MSPQITQIAQIEVAGEANGELRIENCVGLPEVLRACVGCGVLFKPRRGHQKYCSKDCRYSDNNGRNRVVRVSVAEASRIRAARNRAEKRVTRFSTPMDVPAPVRRRRMPVEAKLAFSYQQAPGNIKGLLARVAVNSPQTMLRLAGSLKEDGGSKRPSCIGCSYGCEDGAPCEILAQELRITKSGG